MNLRLQTNRLRVAKSNKNRAVETLRGLAIVMIVFGHVIGVDAMGGMKVADGSFWRYLYVSTQYGPQFFTVIAGWVYALRPVHSAQVGDFVWKKFCRLIIPTIFVGTLYFLLQYSVPGTNMQGELSQIWKIWIFPYTVYWYLPSLFLIFVFVALLDSLRMCNTLRSWSGWMLLACAMLLVEQPLSANIPNVFSIWGAVCLLPFFLVGVGIRRFEAQLSSPRMQKIYLAGFAVGFILQQAIWFAGYHDLYRDWKLYSPVGMLGSAFLMTLTWRNRFMIWLGSFAYSIYLFHAFGTSAGRILLTSVGIHSQVAIFALSMVLGLGAPVVVDLVLKYFPLLQTLFLGKRFQRQKKAHN